jgi:hypothetical protein
LGFEIYCGIIIKEEGERVDFCLLEQNILHDFEGKG